MFAVDKDAFKLMAMGATYPYNEIRATRQGFIATWLILEATQPTTIRFKAGTKLALHTSCVDNSTSTHLIVTKQGMPLPQDYSDIMDCMDWWGRTISPRWHENVTEYMYYKLKSGDKLSREKLFKQCIEFHISDRLNSELTINQESAPWIEQQWSYFFDRTYEFDSKDFFDCAVRSIQFMRNRVSHMVGALAMGATWSVIR